jgi:hypothetical protein
MRSSLQFTYTYFIVQIAAGREASSPRIAARVESERSLSNRLKIEPTRIAIQKRKSAAKAAPFPTSQSLFNQRPLHALPHHCCLGAKYPFLARTW